ncbi:MAG: hypothetical protein ACI80M_000971, partial [Gammaproteobacteria bacterium]
CVANGMVFLLTGLLRIFEAASTPAAAAYY